MDMYQRVNLFEISIEREELSKVVQEARGQLKAGFQDRLTLLLLAARHPQDVGHHVPPAAPGG